MMHSEVVVLLYISVIPAKAGIQLIGQVPGAGSSPA
jgi:hypothetical protein